MSSRASRFIGCRSRHRLSQLSQLSQPVTAVPHAGNQHCLIQTGLSFNGVQVCLLVPSNSEQSPLEHVKNFVIDFKRMHRRSEMVTLRDCYEKIFERLEFLS